MSIKQMETVELPVPKLSKIPLPHDIKMSFDIGELRQLLALECYPGDIFKMRIAYMVRFAPLIVPIFHRLDIKFRSFFVPNRLVWDKWQDWITYQLPDVSVPTFTMKQVIEVFGDSMVEYQPDYLKFVSRFDDLDLPVVKPIMSGSERTYTFGNKNTLPLSVFPLRGGNLIWNEYYRHQFLQNKMDVFENIDTVSEDEIISYNGHDFCVGWEKDYFTLATTEPQLGDDVLLPVTNNSHVITTIYGVNNNTGGPLQINAGSNNPVYTPGVSPGSQTFSFNKVSSPEKNIFVTPGTINDFYNTKAVARWKYKLQLAGQRYNEQILAKFGVVTPDYRIQRPEYIGGDTKPVSVGRVINSNGAEGSVLGSYAGEMSVFGETTTIDYEVEEYGFIHTYMYIVPTSSYYQGIPRSLVKRNIFDYYDPDFSRVGDQEVLNDEIFARDGDNNGIFGYQLRYSQYKFIQDKIRGEFRTTLSYWHMGREFAVQPNLNSEFVKLDARDPNLTRLWSVRDTDITDHIYSEFYLDIEMYRPMLVDALPEYITDME